MPINAPHRRGQNGRFTLHLPKQPARLVSANKSPPPATTPAAPERPDPFEVLRNAPKRSENLHRAELTALERNEHIAEWIRLAEKQPAQVEPAVLKDGRRAGPQHQEAGVRKAARDLGLSEPDARRATKEQLEALANRWRR